MSATADVAIVVRTKNRPQLLARALRSISDQSFTSWECVIVNDGGVPGDVEDAVAALDGDVRTRVRVIHHEESRGRWRSANAGVLATSAPLLILHDDDDSWHPEFLSRAVDYLAENPSRDGVVSRIEILWEQATPRGLEVVSRETFQPQLHDLLLSDALLFNRYVPIGFVYRRSLHEELGLYDESLPVIGDWSFNLRVLTRGPLEFLDGGPFAYWHQRRDDTTPTGNSVIESSGDHEKFDALLRDDALRSYVSAEGLGLVLYLTKFIDRRFVEVEAGIRAEVRQARSLTGLFQRVRARLRG